MIMRNMSFYAIEKFAKEEIAVGVPNFVRWFNKNYEFLLKNNYTVDNQFDTYDGDYNSYVVKTNNDKVKAIVLGAWTKYGGSKMVIFTEEKYDRTGYTVMKVHKKPEYDGYRMTKITAEYLAEYKFDIEKIPNFYGDCRDKSFWLKIEVPKSIVEIMGVEFAAKNPDYPEREINVDTNLKLIPYAEIAMNELNALSCSVI
jgi:hypothetical protein